MTQQRLRDLGLELDELESGARCQKRLDINQGQVVMKWKVTTGMLYMIRSLGVCLAHCAMIHAGMYILAYLILFLQYQLLTPQKKRKI